MSVATQSANSVQNDRAMRIIAKSLYRELTAQGYADREIVSLATELLGTVTERIAEENAANVA